MLAFGPQMTQRLVSSRLGPHAGLAIHYADEPITELAFNRWDVMGDYQSVFCITIIEAAIRRARVTFVASDAKGAELAKALESDWLDYVRNIAKAYVDGRAAFEILWENRVENGIDVTVPVMEFVPPDNEGDPYSKMALTKNGEYAGIKLADDEIEKRAVTIPADQSWWFGLDATRIYPYGKTRIQDATLKELRRRKELFKLHASFMRRHALVGGTAHVDRTVVDPNTGEIIDNFSVVSNLLAGWVNGSWAIFSNERDSFGNYKNDIKPSDKLTDPEPLERSIAASDVRLSRSMGLYDKLATEGIMNGATEGSLTIHLDTFLSMIDDIVRQAAASWNRHVAPMVAEKNGGRKVRAVSTPSTDEITKALIDVAKSIITNNTLSPMVMSGALDVLGMFERVGLPLTGNARAAIEQTLKAMREKQVADTKDTPPSGFVQAGPRADGNNGGNPNDPMSKAQGNG